jgi:heme a synthase
MGTSTAAKPDRPVGIWLLAICVCVLAMILVGGATRLTDSGLSITEWRLDKGLTPPLSAARWAEEFALYQRTAEYQLQNRGMSLGEFQAIYWWEWAHRFLGKMIGLVFALPLLWFWARGQLRGRLWPVLGLFALGGLQGAIGWWMVQSGLAGRLDVSPWRLAVHLGLAFLIIGAALWLALDAFGWPGKAAEPATPRSLVLVFLAALFAQVLLGALLAGADGGPAYADWPRIGGEWWPSSYAALEPFLRNLAENRATQHFNHRTLGYAVAGLALVIAAFGALRGEGAAHRLAITVGGLALAQAGLGVAAVMNAVPLPLALAHQAGAALLWLAGVALLRSLGKPIPSA